VIVDAMVVIFGDMDEGLPVLHDLSKTAKKDDRAELLNQGAVDQRHLEDNGESPRHLDPLLKLSSRPIG